jgi:hypothetical protein
MEAMLSVPDGVLAEMQGVRSAALAILDDKGRAFR